MDPRQSKSANITIDEKEAAKGVAVGGGWQGLIAYVNIRCYFIGLLLALLMGYELDLGVKGIWTGIICGTAMQTAILLLITYLTKWNGQVKKHISAETISLGTNKSSQANELTSSGHRQKFDVFLSHSGKQKNFVRQLHRDLTNLGVSCFFDEDPQSLPMGKDFPPRIFEAAETCRLAVLLLSQDFLESKWPMLEASTFMKTRAKNPNLKILPLYFMIPPVALKQIMADDQKWKGIEKSEERRAEWHQALNAIRQINGLRFSEGGNEVEFREKIVKEIWRKLPTRSPRYHLPCMQGEERMCQEVANFFKTVHPNEKGIRIAGLYGIAGHGKTTLGKAICNFRVADFKGKVCHLEFSQGGSFERLKLALHYLTHCSQSHLQTLTSEDQAQVELYKRLKGQRVLLVLDNITEESMGEVTFYVQADLGENSCILLSARSVDVLLKHFKIDKQSCMRVPSLVEEEAIGILLEKTFLRDVLLGAEDKAFALKCAKRCSFKDTSSDISRRGRRFHPLALKALGGHLFGKYGWSLQKWVDEIDGLVDPSGYGLDDVFSVLGKAFDDMHPKYRTIFMLLTVYMPPKLSLDKVSEWLAVNCNEEISLIEKAVEDLCNKAFVEECVPGIRIHDLYIEFGQSKAKEMGRWLWWKGDQRSTRGLCSKDKEGFELVKLENCKYRSPSQIAFKYLQNVLALQLVGVENMSKLDLGSMNGLRSVALHNCKDLEAIEDMEKLLELAWLQIREVHPMFKLPQLNSLQGLQYLEIDIAVSQLGDLSSCFSLREIKVRCPSLMEFPRLNGLPHLEKVEFSMCDKVKEPLDCTNCVELQRIVLDDCCQMVAPPLLTGCKKASKIVLLECDAVTVCPDINVPSALKTLELSISSKVASAPKNLEFCHGLENLQLWGMGELKQLPSFRCLSNLTVLTIGRCGIRESPDLTCCVMLEDVCFFTLKNLENFPNFSSLKKLKNLSLYNCRRVQDPPDISGCHELQVFHLLYNDNLKGLPRMDGCPLLEQIKVSWGCEDEVVYDGIDPNSWGVDDDDESWLEHFKDETFHFRELPEELKGWEWLKSKTMLAKKYFRGVKVYNSITAPYQTSRRSNFYGQNSITLSLRGDKVIAFPTPGRFIEDPDWLIKVQEYFGGKEDESASTSAASGAPPSMGSLDNLQNRDSLEDPQNLTVSYDTRLIPMAPPSMSSLDNLRNRVSLEDLIVPVALPNMDSRVDIIHFLAWERDLVSNLMREVAMRSVPQPPNLFHNHETPELISNVGQLQDSSLTVVAHPPNQFRYNDQQQGSISTVVHPVPGESQPPDQYPNYDSPWLIPEAPQLQDLIHAGRPPLTVPVAVGSGRRELRLDIMLQISRGLEHLHRDFQVSIVHRDFKVSNILIEPCVVPESREHYKDPMGKCYWRVPEAFPFPEYNHKVTLCKDIWSLGITCMETLRGKIVQGRRPILPPTCEKAVSRIFENDIAVSQVGGLNSCYSLRDIIVRRPSLLEFPRCTANATRLEDKANTNSGTNEHSQANKKTRSEDRRMLIYEMIETYKMRKFGGTKREGPQIWQHLLLQFLNGGNLGAEIVHKHTKTLQMLMEGKILPKVLLTGTIMVSGKLVPLSYIAGLLTERPNLRAVKEVDVLNIYSTSRWSAIASHLPGRTEDDIKQMWNTYLKKRLLKMGMDTVIHRRSRLSIDGSGFFHEIPNPCSMGKDFEAAKRCRLGVLFLCKRSLEPNWLMLEASTFLKARDTYPDLRILALYILIPPKALKQFMADNQNWKATRK